MRGVDTSWRPELGGEPIADITVSRNLKERACEAHPTPLRKLVSGPFSISSIFNLPAGSGELKRVTMGEVDFEFSWERFLPAELCAAPAPSPLTPHLSPFTFHLPPHSRLQYPMKRRPPPPSVLARQPSLPLPSSRGPGWR